MLELLIVISRDQFIHVMRCAWDMYWYYHHTVWSNDPIRFMSISTLSMSSTRKCY